MFNSHFFKSYEQAQEYTTRNAFMSGRDWVVFNDTNGNWRAEQRSMYCSVLPYNSGVVYPGFDINSTEQEILLATGAYPDLICERLQDDSVAAFLTVEEMADRIQAGRVWVCNDVERRILFLAWRHSTWITAPLSGGPFCELTLRQDRETYAALGKKVRRITQNIPKPANMTFGAWAEYWR